MGYTFCIFALFWTISYLTIAVKLKTRMKPSMKGLTTRKRAQLPPDLLSFEDESGLMLRDIMKALGTLTT